MATTSGHAGREAIKIDHDTPLVLVGLTVSRVLDPIGDS